MNWYNEAYEIEGSLYEVWVEHIHDTLHSYKNTDWCDVTLSLKPYIFQEWGDYERLSHDEASKFIKELLKRLNIKVYGKAYRRHGKKLLCIPVIEANKMGRLHIHMFLSIPDYMQYDLDEFCVLVLDTAKELRWCESDKHAQNLVRHHKGIQDVDGWVSYILKDIERKPDILDVTNMHLPALA
ncbi:hypothetical protein BRW84_01210 [Oxalobacter formigenes OXCC13]|nr:hypothetical protein BRW84_01210 [Oxalobacter formigenes OXCC13]